MESIKFFFRISGIIVFTFITHVVSGQQNNSLYFLDRVPQSIQLNPALQPSCKFYFGFPALSGIEINAGNNALGIRDVLIKDKDLDMLVTPLYSEKISRDALNKLRKNNIFSSGAQLDLISFGFKIKESYVSFLIADKINMNVNIPKDLATFVYDGIDVGKSYTFDRIGVNANYYREYSIGYSEKLNDRVSFGIRGKMLFGKANISSRQNEITLSEPDRETLQLSSSIKMNSSLPHFKVYTDPSGKPDSTDFEDFDDGEAFVEDLFLLTKNKGFAFDLGFQYNIDDRSALSASILDLGYINWKTNVNTLSGGGDYYFHGVNFNNDSTDEAEAILDTLKDVYDMTVANDPYSTLLNPKLYVGYSYSPNRFFKFGLLSRSELILKTLRQQFTGSITMYPAQILSATVSYTVANRMYDNLGVSLTLRTGPFQMYFMSERIPLFWYKVKGDNIPFIPYYAKDVNFRMGINFVFGANPRRKLMKDQPFLE
ncbi:MAG TPA: DUF5723 family protein [Bacteroidales bacterium]|nr:DUF5723 family protein [Bacteroidales bacterium]